MNTEIYLDNAATTRPFDEVCEYINEINKNFYGNPSSLHKKGIEAEILIKKAREKIAGSLNADTREIIFTSGGTEANNLAIRGYLEANPRAGKQIITSKIEHPSVLEVFNFLSTKGYKVDFISVDSEGMLNLDELKAKISSETTLISIMYVNNEVGTIQPVEEIVKIKNSINRNAAIHVDAVQAFGKFRIFPKKSGIDLLSMSSHKIHGPKGVGALYLGKSVKIKPILFGGGQESLLRSGTENVSGISGFGLAVDKIFSDIDERKDKIKVLKSLFKNELNKNLENIKISTPENSIPNIINVSLRLKL